MELSSVLLLPELPSSQNCKLNSAQLYEKRTFGAYWISRIESCLMACIGSISVTVRAARQHVGMDGWYPSTSDRFGCGTPSTEGTESVAKHSSRITTDKQFVTRSSSCIEEKRGPELNIDQTNSSSSSAASSFAYELWIGNNHNSVGFLVVLKYLLI